MYLYILYNKVLNKYYIGVSGDIKRREKEHLKDSNHGYTGKNKNWKLVFVRKFNMRIDALDEEKRLKNCKNRKYLEWYIKKWGR